MLRRRGLRPVGDGGRGGAFEDEVFEQVVTGVDVARAAGLGARGLHGGALIEQRVVGVVEVTSSEAAVKPRALRLVLGQQPRAVAAVALGVVDVRLVEILPVRREPCVERAGLKAQSSRTALERLQAQDGAMHSMTAIVEAEEIVEAHNVGAVHRHKRDVGVGAQRRRHGHAAAGEVVDQMALRSEAAVAHSEFARTLLELHRV